MRRFLIAVSLIAFSFAGTAPRIAAQSTPAHGNAAVLLETLSWDEAEKILTPEERADKGQLVASLQHRLLQSTFSNQQDQALRDFLDSRPKLNDTDIRNVVRLVMSTPEYQVS